VHRIESCEPYWGNKCKTRSNQRIYFYQSYKIRDMKEETKQNILNSLVSGKSLTTVLSAKAKEFMFESVQNELVTKYETDGWEVYKRYKTSIRMQRRKPMDMAFEDDVCTAPQKLDTFGVFFMKYNYEIRLKAVKLVLEGGLSVREAGCHLGCGRSQVHLWVTLFERHGLAGLKLRHGSYSAEFKLSVLKHMHQNHLSLLETAVHFGIPGPFVIRQWERLYQNQGAEGLRRKPQRRRPAMSKSKTKKVKLKTTPHEELLKELEYLRAENAYLKKLQALVEERIVRESGKEPKPSKD